MFFFLLAIARILGVVAALPTGMLESNEEGVIWNKKHGFLTFVSLNEEVNTYMLWV